MSDPISSALVKGGVKAGVAAAHGLIQKLLGPAAEEIGFMLRDKKSGPHSLDHETQKIS